MALALLATFPALPIPTALVVTMVSFVTTTMCALPILTHVLVALVAAFTLALLALHARTITLAPLSNAPMAFASRRRLPPAALWINATLLVPATLPLVFAPIPARTMAAPAMMAMPARLVINVQTVFVVAQPKCALPWTNVTSPALATQPLVSAPTPTLLMAPAAMTAMPARCPIPASLEFALAVPRWYAPLLTNVTSPALATQPLVSAPTPTSPTALLAVTATHARLVTLAKVVPALLPAQSLALHLTNVMRPEPVILSLAFARTPSRPLASHVTMAMLALRLTVARVELAWAPTL